MLKVLKKFPNLKIISRDRGTQYRNIKGLYTHIADRFHLLMNLSDAMIREIKRVIPREIKIKGDNNCMATNVTCSIEDIGNGSNNSLKKLSNKEIKKRELVLEIKEKFN